MHHHYHILQDTSGNFITTSSNDTIVVFATTPNTAAGLWTAALELVGSIMGPSLRYIRIDKGTIELEAMSRAVDRSTRAGEHYL